MKRACAWCGVVMPANNLEPMEQTTHGVCLPCSIALAEDDFMVFQRDVNGDDELLGVEVVDYDFGVLATVVALMLIFCLFVASTLVVAWRLICG